MKTENDKTALTAAQILAISENAPEKLFTGDLVIAKSEYHALSRRWHPDHNSDSQAVAVFQRLTGLYRKTRELLNANQWRGAGVLELPNTTSGAVSRQFRYVKSSGFELGDLYLGETEIAFSVTRQNADLFENARRRIANFQFADAAMHKEIARNLPGKPQYFETAARLTMILPKPPDAVLLADLVEYSGGAINARHAAWIGSGLQNLACYLDYAGIVHHDISPQTIFVSPVHHSVTLLGGWWYARPAGEKIIALPQRTINFAPADAIRRERADARVDLELIRQTEREMFGGGGARLNAGDKIPAAMTRWLNGATSGSAVTDYELWKNVLELDFGKPRFMPLEIKFSQVYPEPQF